MSDASMGGRVGVEAVGNETATILAAALAARSEEAVRQLLARALISLALLLRRRGIDVGKAC